ncbi:TRAP transporter small permease [Eoetvoesiella caeni]|uniref:TRAP transporter small permease protein n=1 Tax=Eoetvoesiella caeni TaxID=645616 RepID=A0A366HGG0_9BURK|nr:TRAP transporter small permease [Eoetvoesiella caeni]MCI2807774.1 TRAP transporter small permease [Eoetvoesiella caeni]NYT54221.1 TRAP transporter small permease [Eoetvoesiella caeni]RBP41689.1 TRAP-type C4-dicarboxylate transport system permease small subunit [Eoetvoesiella caeni]
MQQTQGWASKLQRAGYLAAGLCAAISLAGIMLLMLVDVTGRYAFNSPVPGAGELIELAMGIVIFSALPLTTAHGEHVKLDYLDGWLRGAAQRVVRFSALGITAAIVAFLAWRVAAKAATIIHYHDTTPFLGIALAPVAIFISAATAITALIFLAEAFASLSGAARPTATPTEY